MRADEPGSMGRGAVRRCFPARLAAAALAALLIAAVSVACLAGSGSPQAPAHSRALTFPDAEDIRPGEGVWDAALIPDVFGEDAASIDAMRSNTISLQKAIDTASESGGTVRLPQGRFYFYPVDEWDEHPADRGNAAHRIIECRSGVSLIGTGSGPGGTVLLPYKTDDEPTDMFYFNALQEGAAEYLEGAVFKNFRIDGIHAVNTGSYNARGKGFFLNLIKGCVWQDVCVANTQGSGFGVDCPKDCLFKDCTALYCGRWGQGWGQSPEVGGSGFGIGCGYAEGESVEIRGCRAVGNARFGFFFEHQKRFRPDLYTASMDGGKFAVVDCRAQGNRWDFGGESAYCLEYERCSSTEHGLDPLDESGNPLGIATEHAFCFQEQIEPKIPSGNVSLIGCTAEMGRGALAVEGGEMELGERVVLPSS